MSVDIKISSVLTLIHNFCLERGLAQTARVFEKEVINVGLTETSIASNLETCGPDLLFVRDLVLDAQWSDLEELCSPLSSIGASSVEFFDASFVLFSIRRQEFLELYHSKFTAAIAASASSVNTTPGPEDVNALIAVLRKAENVAPSRAAFNSLAYVLTLPGGIHSHPDFTGWSPHAGRLASWNSIRPNFERVFPTLSTPLTSHHSQHISSSSTTTSSQQLEQVLSLAAGATIVSRLASDPRLLSSPFPRSITYNPLTPHSIHLDVPGSVLPTEASSQMNHISHLHSNGRGGAVVTNPLGVMVSSGAQHASALTDAAIRIGSLKPALLSYSSPPISTNNARREGGFGQSQFSQTTTSSSSSNFARGRRGGVTTAAAVLRSSDGGIISPSLLAKSLIESSSSSSSSSSSTVGGGIQRTIQAPYSHLSQSFSGPVSNTAAFVNRGGDYPSSSSSLLTTNDLEIEPSQSNNSISHVEGNTTSTSPFAFAFPASNETKVHATIRDSTYSITTDTDIEQRIKARLSSSQAGNGLGSSMLPSTSSFSSSSAAAPTTTIPATNTTRQISSTQSSASSLSLDIRTSSSIDPSFLPPAGLPSRSPSRSHSRGGRKLNPTLETSSFDTTTTTDNDVDVDTKKENDINEGNQRQFSTRGSRWDIAVPPVRIRSATSSNMEMKNKEDEDNNNNVDDYTIKNAKRREESIYSGDGPALSLPPSAWTDTNEDHISGVRNGSLSRSRNSSFSSMPVQPPPPPPVNPHAILLAGTVGAARASLHASAVIGELGELPHSTSTSTALNGVRMSQQHTNTSSSFLSSSSSIISKSIIPPPQPFNNTSYSNHSHSIDNHINVVAAPSPVRAHTSRMYESSSSSLLAATRSSSLAVSVDGVERPHRVPHPSDDIPIVSDELSPWKPHQYAPPLPSSSFSSSFQQNSNNRSLSTSSSSLNLLKQQSSIQAAPIIIPTTTSSSSSSSTLDTSLIDALRSSSASSSVPSTQERVGSGGVGSDYNRLSSSSSSSTSVDESFLPSWISTALVQNSSISSSSLSSAMILSSSASGFLPYGTTLAGNLNPIATLHDSQPIRAVLIDPLAPTSSSSSSSISGASAGLVAVGTNSKALKLARLPSINSSKTGISGPTGSFSTSSSSIGGVVSRLAESVVGTEGGVGGSGHSSLPELDIVRTWSSHHAGSVYCLAWTHADPQCEDALIASGSNDSLVKVTRFNRDGEGGSGVVSLTPEKGTVRDVCWLGGYLRPENQGSITGGGGGVHLACAGSSGGYGICVWDASVLSSTSRTPLVTLSGHTNTVHAVKPFCINDSDASPNSMLISASADGTVRLWDIRSPSHAAMTLFLTSTSGALINVSEKIPSTNVSSSSPVEIHALCTRRNDIVVGCADGTIAIIDVKNSRMIAKERLHDGEIRSVDASGPLLLSSGFDCSIVLSSVVASLSTMTGTNHNNNNGITNNNEASIKILSARRDHLDKTLNAKFHPKQALAVTSSADKTALAWELAIY